MNDLREYYETAFFPKSLPSEFYEPFDELDTELIRSIQGTVGFTGWRLRKRLSAFFRPISEFISKVVNW